MATLTLVQFQDVADSLSAAYDRLVAANATTAANDVRTGAANNQTRVVALAPDLIEALIPGVNTAAAQAVALTKAAATIFGDAVRALNRADVLGHAGTDAFLTALGGTVLPSYAALYKAVLGAQAIAPANIAGPQTTFGAFTLTAAGAGTFSGTGGPIDTATHGPAQAEVVTTTAIGAAAITATLTMLRADNTTASRTVTIPAATANGAALAIGATTDRYVDVSNITVTGGTAGDAFSVRSIAPRVGVL